MRVVNLAPYLSNEEMLIHHMDGILCLKNEDFDFYTQEALTVMYTN